MAIGVNWAEIWAPVWKAVWTQTPPTEVPDVVGELEAVGTTELENAGFVVSSSTAYSDSVAVGLIVSQNPTGGSFAQLGSTVEIVVSLGPAPVVVDDEQPSGGWLFMNFYEAEQRRRRARDKRRKELEEEAEQIQDALDREIAQLLRAQEAKDEKRKDYERLKERLAKATEADIEAARLVSERVGTAFARAMAQGNYSALEALDRELRKAREEEEQFIVLAAMMLLH